MLCRRRRQVTITIDRWREPVAQHRALFTRLRCRRISLDPLTLDLVRHGDAYRTERGQLRPSLRPTLEACRPARMTADADGVALFFPGFETG